LQTLAPQLPPNSIILINLSGRGDKDVQHVAQLMSEASGAN
jgi:tryptophan synthase beta chain